MYQNFLPWADGVAQAVEQPVLPQKNKGKVFSLF
jgi:hypothetical protein